MKYVEYENILEEVFIGESVTYKEYRLSNSNKKQRSLEIEEALVDTIILPNESLYISELERIYGVGLSFETYCSLSSSDCIRLVLKVSEESEELRYHVVTINKDFYETGFQELYLIEMPIQEQFIYVGSNPFM